MSFSKEFLYENYNKYYKIAESAKAEGDLIKMKNALYLASEYLKRLSELSEGVTAIEQLNRANRMQTLADKIVTSTPVRQKKDDISSKALQSKNNRMHPIDNAFPEQMSAFLDFFNTEDLDFGFDQVVGLDEAKEAVREYVINPRLYPQAYNYNFLQGAGILLEGPPGTGKTTFAKALSKELQQPFALVKISGLVNCYVGETAKNIDKLFIFLRSYAQKNQCEITVFFDELDEIAKKRGHDDKTSEAAVPALLRNLGGLQENNGLLIIANTNCKDLLDKALIDRFRKTIHIPLPDLKSREKMFRLKLNDIEKKYQSQIDFSLLAKSSEGLNGRQITYICDDFKRLISKMKAGLIPAFDFNDQFLKLIANK